MDFNDLFSIIVYIYLEAPEILHKRCFFFFFCQYILYSHIDGPQEDIISICWPYLTFLCFYAVLIDFFLPPQACRASLKHNTDIFLFYKVNMVNMSCFFPPDEVKYLLSFQLCFGQLQRNLSGSLAVKCSTLFTS